MKSCDLAATIATLACALANCLTDDELAILIVTMSQLGSTLGTILAVDRIGKENEENESTEEDIAEETTEDEAVEDLIIEDETIET